MDNRFQGTEDIIEVIGLYLYAAVFVFAIAALVGTPAAFAAVPKVLIVIAGAILRIFGGLRG